MSNKRNKRAMFATVREADGTRWQYSVPDYIGKLHEGDTVVVHNNGGDGLELAQVVSIDRFAVHRSCNVTPIVDRVRTGRWNRWLDSRIEKGKLLHDMERRQAEIDAVARYSISADADEAMRDMLERYNKL